MAGETRKLNQMEPAKASAVPKDTVIDKGMPRPWRIALTLVQYQMQWIFDLEGSMLVGRAHAESGFFPDLDLGAYGGGDQGVSREHLQIKLDGSRVVVVDNRSSNGTRLNGEPLKPHEPYPVRPGDTLVLGAMELQVDLLTNPFE